MVRRRQDGAIGRIGTGAPPALAGAGERLRRRAWREAPKPARRRGLPGRGSPDPQAVPVRRVRVVARRHARSRVRPRRPTPRPAGDVGHRLACRLTVTYPLPFSVTATATSAAVTVQAAPPPPQPPTPALSALDISPRMFTLQGAGSGAGASRASRSDRGHRPCTRRVALAVRFTLSVGATVTFAIERALPGRLTRGRCTAPTRQRPPPPPLHAPGHAAWHDHDRRCRGR